MYELMRTSGLLSVVRTIGDNRWFVAEVFLNMNGDPALYRIVEGGAYGDLLPQDAIVHHDLSVQLQQCGSQQERNELFVRSSDYGMPLHSGIRRAGVPVASIVQLPYAAPQARTQQRRWYGSRVLCDALNHQYDDAW